MTLPNADGMQPATPGSYGEAPSGFRLPAGTHIGRVRLQVGDLSRSIAYYEGTLGMRLLRRDASTALFGMAGSETSLVELQELAGAKPAPRGSRLGLYHFAILLPDQVSLGRFIRHLERIGARAGAADHLVSQSLYLQDPDSLGIEVYADRPRDTWQRIGRELMMATDPLDVPSLVRLAGDAPWAGMPAGTRMGHVHLHVGDIATASRFFSDALGFDRTVWQYPGALFLAADGYHHHLGTNTWAGDAAVPPRSDEAQLLEWTIELPNVASIEEAKASLLNAGFPAAYDDDIRGSRALLTHDPWDTRIRLSSP